MNGRPLRILVADKDLAVRNAMDRIIRGHGHLYEGVVDATAFLHKLSQTQYDIIFLDLFLGGMDGSELLQRVRDALPVASIILLSSLDDPVIIDGLLQQGARAYLVKPVRDAVITDVINRIASGTISQDLTPG
jgi:CheY-like chemotaxis protein